MHPSPIRLSRHGIALPVAMVLVAICTISVLSLQRFQRQRYREAHRFTLGTVASHLAESGLNAVLEQVWSQVESHQGELYELLVDTAASDLDGVRREVPHPFEDLLVEVLGSDATLAIEVGVEDARPVQGPDAQRGLLQDPREKSGVLVVDAVGTFQGVTRRVSTRRDFKLVSARAPLLAKFTLFVRGREDQDPNLLGYDRRRPGGAMNRDGTGGRPLVLFHDDEHAPTVAEDRFFPVAPLLEGRPPDAGGLVFLGGEDPWYLNLVHGTGAGPFDELHHLRRTRYRLTDRTPPEHQLWFGFYDGILAAPNFRSSGANSSPPVRPTGEPVSGRTSALHLYGDVEHVSPTVVLGPAFRSFISLRLRDGMWEPYRTPSEFSSSAVATAYSDYAEYSAWMTQVAHEPYNRSYDFMRTNEELVDDQGLVDGGGTPVTPSPHLVADNLRCLRPTESGDLAFLYPVPGRNVPAPVEVSRPVADGTREAIFRGDLQDLDPGGFARLLRAKAVVRVADQTELEARYLIDGKLQIPGIVLVERGPLILADRAVASAAMILVEGPVRIEGWIRKLRPEATLTLVSLTHDLVLSTPARVEASLVALAGRVVLGPGQVDLRGSVAAGALDLDTLTRGLEPKWVRYDTSLDPTFEDRYRSGLRFVMDDRIRLEVSGS